MNVFNPPASFNQRRAIYNMRRALKMDVKGIRDMKSREASEEIKVLLKRIKTEGFPEHDDESYLDGRDGRFTQTEAGDG